MFVKEKDPEMFAKEEDPEMYAAAGLPLSIAFLMN
jgi:hypothetical protein